MTWADNFINLVEYIAAYAVQRPFIYFIGVVVIGFLVKLFWEVFR